MSLHPGLHPNLHPNLLLPLVAAQALVKLSLNRYRVGMPLTSQCDGDVMQRCQVDKVRVGVFEGV